MQLNKLLYYAIITLSVSCKEKFEPPILLAGTNYLVVEGLINSGGEPTQIQLSRTAKLADTTVLKPESGAEVRIEGDNNTQYPLTENRAGIYTVDPIYLNTTTKYRVYIKTSDNKEYVSDFVPVKEAPAIDSVSWKKVNDDQVQISVNTHDPENKTRYYKWVLEETWEYHSVFRSHLRYDSGNFIRRDSMNSTFRCWHNVNVPTILLGSSVKLAEDVIADIPVMVIPKESEKLRWLYSMLVKQYVLTKEAYEYWSLLRKNTEQIGSIFDAQPSQLTGNLYCLTNPEEPVIGYITAGSVTQKRVFISYSELAPWLYPAPLTECRKWIVERDQPDSFEYYFNKYAALFSPIDSEYILGQYVGISRSYTYCADCTEAGGTHVKPSYWPY